VPDQTVNTLIDLNSLKVLGDSSFDTDAANRPQPGPNEFSGKSFHVLNFVADLPVRVDALLPPDHDERRGRVVFVLAEFQVMDKRTAEANEQGESSHAEYKRRQHQHVRMRLLREPRDG